MTLRRGDFGGVGGEDGEDADVGEEFEGLGAGIAGGAEAAEGSAEAAALRGGGLVEQSGAAAALAVVGFCEVDQFEVEGEGACEAIGGGGFAGACGGGCGLAGERLGFVEKGLRVAAIGFGFAAGDGGAAQAFDGVEDGVAGLFTEDLSEECAERADVAAQRGLLGIACAGFKLGQALRPVGWGPKGRA